jgi:hypothetical protein
VAGTPALPNGTTATSQTATDQTLKLATDQFVYNALAISNAATATAFASTPSQCATGSVATGITANGTANCTTNGIVSLTSTGGTINITTPASGTRNIEVLALGQPTSGDALNLTDLQANQLVGTVSSANLPGVLPVYNTAAGYAMSQSNAGQIIEQNNSLVGCPFTLPAIGSSNGNITPGSFQSIVYVNSSITCSITPTTATINGSAVQYLGQYGWALITADNNSSAYNYVSLVGGGYTFSGAGTAIWVNPIKVPMEIFTSYTSSTPSCISGQTCITQSATDQLGTYTNGILATNIDTAQNFHLEALELVDTGAPTITLGGNCTGSAASITGAGWHAGTFLTGTTSGTGVCTIVLTGLPSNANGWVCGGSDGTKGTTLFQNNTTILTTSCPMNTGVTTASGDRIWWRADPIT